MPDKNNEVFFGEYCKTCKYKNISEEDSPCAECIAEPVNLYSHKPVKWEEADGIFAGPSPRPDHAYQRAVKYIPEKRKDKEKAIARQNIDAEYSGNKVQTIDNKVTDDQYPSATAVKKALDGSLKAINETLDNTIKETSFALSKKIDAPSGCNCDELIAVEEIDEDGNITKTKTVPSPKKLSDFENDLYYKKKLYELAVTKDDFVEATVDGVGMVVYIYRKSPMVDPLMFKNASIACNIVRNDGEEISLNRDQDFEYSEKLDENGNVMFNGFNSLHSPDMVIINGFDLLSNNLYDGVEIVFLNLTSEEFENYIVSLTITIECFETKTLPDYAVDFTPLYEIDNNLFDEIDNLWAGVNTVQTKINETYCIPVVTTTGTSVNYKVTTPNDIGNHIGDLLIVIPHVTSTDLAFNLTINNGKKSHVIMYRTNFNPGSSAATNKNWFTRYTPFILLRTDSYTLTAIGASSLTDTGTVNFGYCSTANNISEKKASLSTAYLGSGSGGIFAIVFTNDNTATNPKLYVTGTNNTYVYVTSLDIVTADGTPILPEMIKAGKLYLFSYTGTFNASPKTGFENKFVLLNPEKVEDKSEKVVLGEFTVEEDLTGNNLLSVELSDDPFSYSAILIKLHVKTADGEAESSQYMGEIHGACGKKSIVMHLNTLIGSEFRNVFVFTSLFKSMLYTTATISEGYQWNQTTQYSAGYSYGTGDGSNIFKIVDSSISAGTTILIEGVR